MNSAEQYTSGWGHCRNQGSHSQVALQEYAVRGILKLLLTLCSERIRSRRAHWWWKRNVRSSLAHHLLLYLIQIPPARHCIKSLPMPLPILQAPPSLRSSTPTSLKPIFSSARSSTRSRRNILTPLTSSMLLTSHQQSGLVLLGMLEPI